MAKVRDTAGGLYGRAKARYAGSDAMQKAGYKAGHAAAQMNSRLREASGKATSGPTADKVRHLSGRATSGPTADKVRHLSGRATSGPMADKVRHLSGKATAAVKHTRTRKPEDR